MKLWNVVAIIIVSLLSSKVLADIHLNTPSQLKLKIVNNEISKNENPLLLENGKNQIAFRYEDRYRSAGEDVFFTSDIILLTFEGHDNNYFITLPKLRTESERTDFNNNPVIILKDSNGKTVSFEQGKLLKNGIQFNRDLISELRVYNQTSQLASLKQPTSIISVADNQSETDVAGKMLDYWYSKADEKTRAAFKARIN
ncbi:DUF2057 domain-containing protein [Psychromonas sp. SP041]|uniref:YccT family protein n=1 Tax=Psychromonas sp. SP041 TaxID=1365007 RepID=UPI0010C7C383|nr:DUF2057 domain-containing protein [Psychromonas sp. SP041]